MNKTNKSEARTLTLPTVLAFGGNAFLPVPDNPGVQDVRAEAAPRIIVF